MFGTLGAMLGKIRVDEKAPPALKAAYDDIDDINVYPAIHARRPALSKRLSADSLAGFVEKVLLIVGH